MRRYFVAVLTALTVVIGLATVAVGTASASTPTRTVNLSCDVASGGTSCTLRYNGRDVGTCTLAGQTAPATCRKDVEVDRGNGGSDCPGDLYPNLNGCQHNGGGVGLPRYNNCSDYNRNGIRDIRRGDVRYNQSWDRNNNGIACDTGDVIVSSDGNCVTYVDQNRNYGNLYNQNYPTWNNLNGRNLRRENLSASDRRDLERLARQLNDYRNQWNTTSNQLRTICNDPTPPVTIINQAAPIPAPVVVTQAPAAASAPTYGSVPRGSVNTGGFSVAYMLAHARAV